MVASFLLGDKIADSPEFLALSSREFWAYINVLCWSVRYRTSGLVPSQAVGHVGGFTLHVAARLVDVGLLVKCDDGYRLREELASGHPIYSLGSERVERGVVSTEGSVYFIREGADGPIKIGRSRNPQARLSSMLTGSARELHLLGVIESSDTHTLERELHERFSDHRIRGEWFEPTHEILSLVEAEAVRG